MSDLLYVDPLGYDCIQEEEIELAFMAVGKTARLPRTCLPEPCRAALTQVQLASLIGRPPSVEEWDDYYSRYADYCRKEVVDFAGIGWGAAADPETGTEAFWAPLVASYPANAPARASLASGSRSYGGFTSMGFGAGSLPASTSASTPGASFTDTPQSAAVGTVESNANSPENPVYVRYPDVKVGETTSEASIGVVPLPAGFLLGLTGIACLALRRRRGLSA